MVNLYKDEIGFSKHEYTVIGRLWTEEGNLAQRALFKREVRDHVRRETVVSARAVALGLPTVPPAELRVDFELGGMAIDMLRSHVASGSEFAVRAEAIVDDFDTRRREAIRHNVPHQ